MAKKRKGDFQSEQNYKQHSFDRILSSKRDKIIDNNKIIHCDFSNLARRKSEEDALKKVLDHAKQLDW